MLDRIKTHFRENKKLYIGIGVGAGIAGITLIGMRRYSTSLIQNSSNVLAQNSSNVLGKTTILNNVSYISQERQGPPSWVVRCIETGEIFPSQKKAAETMNISASNLSQHLNGLLEHADGNTFERICMAA